MRCVYDATVPVGRQGKYLAALRAQFGKGAEVTATAIEGRPLARPRAGHTHAAPTLARVIVMVPE